MTASHRSHRRKKAGNAARLGLAGVAGILGVVTVAVLMLVVRTHGHKSAPEPDPMAASTTAMHPMLDRLKTGAKLNLSTPDGYTYTVAAVRGGTADKPLASNKTPPPAGATLAYIDYVLANTGTQPALLDFPADLFVRRSLVPASVLATQRCIPEPGVPSDLCTLPDHTDLINTLGYPAPKSQEGDRFMPPGASYLVRVATDMGVSKDVQQDDLGLYVWNTRFVPDRNAVRADFP